MGREKGRGGREGSEASEMHREAFTLDAEVDRTCSWQRNAHSNTHNRLRQKNGKESAQSGLFPFLTTPPLLPREERTPPLAALLP